MISKISYTICFVMLAFIASGTGARANELTDMMFPETYAVTLAPTENGSYTIDPIIPANGKVAAGTVLTVKAIPSSNHSLDVIYYTVKGGMWGTTSYESFTPTMKITVTKDMLIGATFVERSLVENISVTHDVVYAKPGIKPLKYDVFSPKKCKEPPLYCHCPRRWVVIKQRRHYAWTCSRVGERWTLCSLQH